MRSFHQVVKKKNYNKRQEIRRSFFPFVSLFSGRHVIDHKWVFKIKPGHKDVPPRFKSRLVAKGFTQQYGVDYEETFAPVIKHVSLRTVLGAVAAFDLDMVQLDVKTAFLYGNLKEEIYMAQPKGFVVPGSENRVCRLVKCIYGNVCQSFFTLSLTLCGCILFAYLFVLMSQ